MVMDSGALGIRHGLLDSLKLLGNFTIGSAGPQLRDDRATMPVGTLEPCVQRALACMGE